MHRLEGGEAARVPPGLAVGSPDLSGAGVPSQSLALVSLALESCALVEQSMLLAFLPDTMRM